MLFFKTFCKVVQYHRRLRHIAPGSFFGKFIGAGRNSRGSATHPLAPRGIATELDRCQTGVSCGLAAAYLRCRHSGGDGAKWAAQSEPDRRDAPRHKSLRVSAGNPTGLLFPPGQRPGPAEVSYH